MFSPFLKNPIPRGDTTETREEMKEDEGQSHPDTPPDASRHQGDAEFNEIVDEYIHAWMDRRSSSSSIVPF